MSTNYYMHLMDDKPAYFDKQDKCIYFMNHFHKLKQSDILCTSLKQVRSQQEKSRATRAALHISADNWHMDYLRIPIVEQPND